MVAITDGWVNHAMVRIVTAGRLCYHYKQGVLHTIYTVGGFGREMTEVQLVEGKMEERSSAHIWNEGWFYFSIPIEAQ